MSLLIAVLHQFALKGNNPIDLSISDLCVLSIDVAAAHNIWQLAQAQKLTLKN